MLYYLGKLKWRSWGRGGGRRYSRGGGGGENRRSEIGTEMQNTDFTLKIQTKQCTCVALVWTCISLILGRWRHQKHIYSRQVVQFSEWLFQPEPAEGEVTDRESELSKDGNDRVSWRKIYVQGSAV